MCIIKFTRCHHVTMQMCKFVNRSEQIRSDPVRRLALKVCQHRRLNRIHPYARTSGCIECNGTSQEIASRGRFEFDLNLL